MCSMGGELLGKGRNNVSPSMETPCQGWVNESTNKLLLVCYAQLKQSGTNSNYFWFRAKPKLKIYTCFNYGEKIKFRIIHIFREGNACADKLVNLKFIHRESFHWYNRFPSYLFL